MGKRAAIFCFLFNCRLTDILTRIISISQETGAGGGGGSLFPPGLFQICKAKFQGIVKVYLAL